MPLQPVLPVFCGGFAFAVLLCALAADYERDQLPVRTTLRIPPRHASWLHHPPKRKPAVQPAHRHGPSPCRSVTANLHCDPRIYALPDPRWQEQDAPDWLHGGIAVEEQYRAAGESPEPDFEPMLQREDDRSDE